MDNYKTYQMPPLVFLLEDEESQREAVTKGFKDYFSMFEDPSLPSSEDFECFQSYESALERLTQNELANRPLIGILDYDMSGANWDQSKRPSSSLIYELNNLNENNYDNRLVMGIIYSGQALNAFQDPIFNKWEGDLQRYGSTGKVPILLRQNKGSAAKLSADIKLMSLLIGHTCSQIANIDYELELSNVDTLEEVKKKLTPIVINSGFDLYQFGKNLSNKC